MRHCMLYTIQACRLQFYIAVKYFTVFTVKYNKYFFFCKITGFRRCLKELIGLLLKCMLFNHT